MWFSIRMFASIRRVYCRTWPAPVSNVTVLELVGGVPGGKTPRVADSSAAGACRFHTSCLLVPYRPLDNQALRAPLSIYTRLRPDAARELHSQRSLGHKFRNEDKPLLAWRHS